MSPSDEITTREALTILGLKEPSNISRLVADDRLSPTRRLPGKRGAMWFLREDIIRLRDERAAAAAERAAASAS